MTVYEAESVKLVVSVSGFTTLYVDGKCVTKVRTDNMSIETPQMLLTNRNGEWKATIKQESAK